MKKNQQKMFERNDDYAWITNLFLLRLMLYNLFLYKLKEYII